MLISALAGIVAIPKAKIDVAIIDFFNVFIFALFPNLFVGWAKIPYYESESHKQGEMNSHTLLVSDRTEKFLESSKHCKIF